MDEVVKEFLIESHENLNQLDHDLIELEKDPHSKDLLGSVFRTIHSIKGVSGFLDFPKLEALTHAGEELLSKLRDGHLVLNQAITSVLLATVDAVRQMLAKIEADGNDGERDYADIVAQLAQLCVDEDAAPEVEAAAPTVEAASPAPAHEPPHELPPAPEVDEVIAKEPEAEAAPAPVAELAPEAKKKPRPTRKPKVSQPEPVAAPIEASPAPVEAAAPLPVAREATTTPSAPLTAAPADPSTPP